jgi:uncharacterized protein (DUF697 family)
MTENQRKKCHAIIHTGAAAAGGGNLLPIPGTGFAADTVALTTMACGLAAVFGKELSTAAARAIALSAIKREIMKKPLKSIGKELSKLIPFGGQAASAAVSIAMAEAAGWSMAKEFDDNKLQ